MTDRARRRRPAEAARRLVGGASAAGFLALVAVLSSATQTPGTEQAAATPAPPVLRVIVTDAAIDRDTAITAALDAAARGVDRVAVPVAGAAAQDLGRMPDVSHSTTRAS
jgi:hypothetical protein